MKINLFEFAREIEDSIGSTFCYYLNKGLPVSLSEIDVLTGDRFAGLVYHNDSLDLRVHFYYDKESVKQVEVSHIGFSVKTEDIETAFEKIKLIKDLNLTINEKGSFGLHVNLSLDELVDAINDADCAQQCLIAMVEKYIDEPF